MMIWESLTASVKTASSGGSSASVSSRIDTANSSNDDNGEKNSNVVNSPSSSPSSSPPRRPSSLSLCITHDRFEHLLELLEAETKPSSSSSSSLSHYTSVKFLQCTRLPPPQVLHRMDRIQHLSFTQCHGLTSLLIDHHDHHDDDDDMECSCCCCWSTSIQTLTLTDCPDLMMFSKSLTENAEQEDASKDDDTTEDDATTSPPLSCFFFILLETTTPTTLEPIITIVQVVCERTETLHRRMWTKDCPVLVRCVDGSDEICRSRNLEKWQQLITDFSNITPA
mmetsp:Transcript_52823/g.128066  ORF Transcript_52823/g.128066 Transcript_52823/m.128066 type:complete len:281 (-) Transcript_52823:3006-3848(-)